MSAFAPAKRTSVKARIALFGPSKSGKTYSALSIASGLGERVALIDTENGSASLYAEDFAFDTARLDPPFHPRRFAEAINAAVAEGYDVVIVDGISPAWNGPGGVQEIVDKNQKGGNKFSGWAVGSPAHRELIDAIVHCKAHLICTIRSKTAYTLDEKNKPVRVGLEPIQRDEVEYEFHILGEIDRDHRIHVAGRGAFADRIVDAGSATGFGGEVREWLASGEPPAQEDSPAASGTTAAHSQPAAATAGAAAPAAGEHHAQTTSEAITAAYRKLEKDVGEENAQAAYALALHAAGLAPGARPTYEQAQMIIGNLELALPAQVTA